MNNKRTLGITFGILGIICVVLATVHAINEPIADSMRLLLAYGAMAILFLVIGKALFSNRADNTLQSYR